MGYTAYYIITMQTNILSIFINMAAIIVIMNLDNYVGQFLMTFMIDNEHVITNSQCHENMKLVATE